MDAAELRSRGGAIGARADDAKARGRQCRETRCRRRARNSDGRARAEQDGAQRGHCDKRRIVQDGTDAATKPAPGSTPRTPPRAARRARSRTRGSGRRRPLQRRMLSVRSSHGHSTPGNAHTRAAARHSTGAACSAETQQSRRARPARSAARRRRRRPALARHRSAETARLASRRGAVDSPGGKQRARSRGHAPHELAEPERLPPASSWRIRENQTAPAKASTKPDPTPPASSTGSRGPAHRSRVADACVPAEHKRLERTLSPAQARGADVRNIAPQKSRAALLQQRRHGGIVFVGALERQSATTARRASQHAGERLVPSHSRKDGRSRRPQPERCPHRPS